MNRGQTTLDFAIGVSVFILVVVFVLTFIPGMVQPFETSTQQETAASDRLAGQLAGDLLAKDVQKPYVLDRECTIAFFENEDANPNDNDAGANTDGAGDGFGAIYDDSTTTNTYDCTFGDDPLSTRLALGTSGLNVRVRLVADLDTTDESIDPGEAASLSIPAVDTLCLDANDRRIVEAADPRDPDDDGDGTAESFEQQCQVIDGDDDVVFAIGETPPTDSSSVVSARRVVQIEGGLADGSDTAALVVEVW